ncbi:PREDICTED: polyphenol oxidase C, chloroplastic-like [Nelumbo nucifera]|uniref:Polyphenol oxidase C, chloroplastic-like n=1 Tax=Nelumbo nucifera TaxID=4432 RepID=A0A1U7Z046_NELNU|nr:PREDICTED: polyphenol oxidase C, chloroplastic-like [Nelumbo nucifera]
MSMSLSLQTTINPRSGSFSTCASPFLCHSISIQRLATRPRLYTVPVKKNQSCYTLCRQQQGGVSVGDDHGIMDRRSILISFVGVSAVVAGFFSLGMMAIEGPKRSSDKKNNGGASRLQQVSEFGSEPRLLDTAIRALIERPKMPPSGKSKRTETLVVYGIDIPKDGAVRLDIYVAKPQGDSCVGPDLGAFAGSLVVDVARNLIGVGRLELGLTGIMKEISAEESEKLVVTLVPTAGEVVIGGVRVDLGDRAT